MFPRFLYVLTMSGVNRRLRRFVAAGMMRAPKASRRQGYEIFVKIHALTVRPGRGRRPWIGGFGKFSDLICADIVIKRSWFVPVLVAGAGPSHGQGSLRGRGAPRKWENSEAGFMFVFCCFRGTRRDGCVRPVPAAVRRRWREDGQTIGRSRYVRELPLATHQHGSRFEPMTAGVPDGRVENDRSPRRA